MRQSDAKNGMAEKATVKGAETIDRENVGAGVGTERQVLIGSDQAPHFALRRFIMKPGGGMPKHTNSVEHEQYILKGKARVGLGDEIREVKAGDVVYIPANLPHWYEADEKEGFEFLCIVPNKEDVIKILEEK